MFVVARPFPGPDSQHFRFYDVTDGGWHDAARDATRFSSLEVARAVADVREARVASIQPNQLDVVVLI
jgi:hypothetical protein